MWWLWVLIFYKTLGSGAGGFTNNPQSQNVTEGSTLMLTCSFSYKCAGNHRIIFYVKRSQDVRFDSVRLSERLKRDDNTSKCGLIISPVTKEDEGEYYCYNTEDPYSAMGVSSKAYITVVPDAPRCYIVKNTSTNTVDLICNSTTVSDKLSWLNINSSLSSRLTYSLPSHYDVYSKTFTCVANHGTRKCSVQPRPIELEIRGHQPILEVRKSASYECIANANPTITSYVWTLQNKTINERDLSKNIHVNENGTVLHFTRLKTKFIGNIITCTVSNAIDKETVSEQMIFDVLESTSSIPITVDVVLQDSNETPTYSSTIEPYHTKQVRHMSTVQSTTLASDLSIPITETIGLHDSNETPTYSSRIEATTQTRVRHMHTLPPDPLNEDTVNGRPNSNNNSSYYISIGSVCVIAIVLAVIIVLLRRKSRSVRERSMMSNKGTKSLGEYESDTGDGTKEGQAVNSVDLYHVIEGSSSKEDVPPNIEGMYAMPDKTKINGGRHIGIATGEPIQTKNDVENNGGDSHDNQVKGNDKTRARKVDETPTNGLDSLYAKPNKPKHKPNELEDTTEWVENYIYSMGGQPRDEGVVRLNASLAESLYTRPNKERSEKNV